MGGCGGMPFVAYLTGTGIDVEGGYAFMLETERRVEIAQVGRQLDVAGSVGKRGVGCQMLAWYQGLFIVVKHGDCIGYLVDEVGYVALGVEYDMARASSGGELHLCGLVGDDEGVGVLLSYGEHVDAVSAEVVDQQEASVGE